MALMRHITAGTVSGKKFQLPTNRGVCAAVGESEKQIGSKRLFQDFQDLRLISFQVVWICHELTPAS
jgi:hypothetical protein